MLIMLTASFGCSSDSDSPKTIVQCPKGFAGSDCSYKISPSKISITKVEILDFPEFDYNNKTYWDANESGDNRNPDLYFALYGNSGYFYTESLNANNANADTDYTFNLVTPIEIKNINSPIIFELRDYNASNNTYDEMARSNPFFVYNPSDKDFPETMIIINPTDLIQVKLYLTYTW